MARVRPTLSAEERSALPLSELLAAGYTPAEAETIKWGFEGEFGAGNADAFRAAEGLTKTADGQVLLSAGTTPEEEAARQEAQSRYLYETMREESAYASEQQRIAALEAAERDRALVSEMLQKQLDAQNKAEAQRAAAEQAAAAAKEAERLAVEQKAAERAVAQKTYTEGRTQYVNEATDQINAAYSGFDDDYYKSFENQFVDYYRPEIRDQYNTAQKGVTYGYADKGGLDSSAAVKDFADLLKKKREVEGGVATNALSASDQFKANIESQRRGLISDVSDASVIGEEILPEDISDPTGALSQIGANITPYTDLARTNAAGTNTPSFNALGEAFAGASSGAGSSSGTSSGIADQIYDPSQNNVRIIA